MSSRASGWSGHRGCCDAVPRSRRESGRGTRSVMRPSATRRRPPSSSSSRNLRRTSAAGRSRHRRSIRPRSDGGAPRVALGVMTSRARTRLVLGMGVQRLMELRISARNRRSIGTAEQASPHDLPTHGRDACRALRGLRMAASTTPCATSVEAAALMGLAASAGLRMWVIRTLGDDWNVTAHVRPGYPRRNRGAISLHPAPELRCSGAGIRMSAARRRCRPEGAALSLANAAVLVPRIRAEERLLDAVPGYREAFRGVPRFLPRPGRRSRQIPASEIQSLGVSAANV